MGQAPCTYQRLVRSSPPNRLERGRLASNRAAVLVTAPPRVVVGFVLLISGFLVALPSLLGWVGWVVGWRKKERKTARRRLREKKKKKKRRATARQQHQQQHQHRTRSWRQSQYTRLRVFRLPGDTRDDDDDDAATKIQPVVVVVNRSELINQTTKNTHENIPSFIHPTAVIHPLPFHYFTVHP